MTTVSTKQIGLKQRIGQRGTVLLLLAFGWAFIGLGVLIGAEAVHPATPHLSIPAPIRAGLWFGTAGYAAWSAFQVRDRWAFAGLVAMPLLRCCSWLWAWITWLIPGAPLGAHQGWYTSVFYALMIGFVVFGVKLPEPQDDRQVPR